MAAESGLEGEGPLWGGGERNGERGPHGARERRGSKARYARARALLPHAQPRAWSRC